MHGDDAHRVADPALVLPARGRFPRRRSHAKYAHKVQHHHAIVQGTLLTSSGEPSAHSLDARNRSGTGSRSSARAAAGQRATRLRRALRRCRRHGGFAGPDLYAPGAIGVAGGSTRRRRRAQGGEERQRPTGRRCASCYRPAGRAGVLSPGPRTSSAAIIGSGGAGAVGRTVSPWQHAPAGRLAGMAHRRP